MPQVDSLQSEDEAVLDEVLRRWISDGCPKGRFLQYWAGVEHDIETGAFKPQRRRVSKRSAVRH